MGQSVLIVGEEAEKMTVQSKGDGQRKVPQIVAGWVWGLNGLTAVQTLIADEPIEKGPWPLQAADIEAFAKNVPSWAYPRAWTCAVLAIHEKGRSHSPSDGKDILAILERYHALRLSGQTHATSSAALLAEMPTRDRLSVARVQTLIDAYARGMEKPAGLLARPRATSG